MSIAYPTSPKLIGRNSFDDEDLTDIDDEVFIRDGKSCTLELDDDGSVNQPLMAPRRKYKKAHNFETLVPPNRAIYLSLCFGILALIILLCLIILCIYILNMVPMPISILKKWLSHDFSIVTPESMTIPCTSIATKVLWTRSLPKLTSESPLRSNDVNNDGVEDIIVGFSTGLDKINIPEYVCMLYFEGQVPCFGGVLALNGNTGDTLWTHWATHAIFSVDCGLDLTSDKIKDCIICGHGGILHAINGRDGTSIWELPIRDLSISEEEKLSDVYDAKFIADIDGDKVGDIIASHTMQSTEIHASEILVISGVSGKIIQSSILPSTEQLFLAPQKLVHPDGESIFVVVTSSNKHSGGVYIIPQINLMYGNLKLQKLHYDIGKGTLLPPILVDVTLDGVEDIVAAMFNSTIVVFNGLTFEPIWNYTIPNSEIISIPIPGYYNDDNIPDFMVKHQIKSGFPAYYYTVATIIDGKTGKSLLEKPIEDTLSKQMSGLSVTVDGFGNDWFLHWSVDCLNYDGIKEKYQFLKNEDLISESRIDMCKLRFNSTLITNLYALSQHVGPPGVSLYFSEDWKSLEFNNSMKLRLEYDENIPYTSERLRRINANKNTGIVITQKPKSKISHDFEIYDTQDDKNDKLNVQEQSIDYQEVHGIRKRRNDFNYTFMSKLDSVKNHPLKMILRNNMNTTNKTGISEQSNDFFTNFDNGNAGNNDMKTVVLNNGTKTSLRYNIMKGQKTANQMLEDTAKGQTHNLSATIRNEGIIATQQIFKQGMQGHWNTKRSLKPKTNLVKQRKKRDETEKAKQLYPVHGVQKQPPTGILLPSILRSDHQDHKTRSSIDLIFSTFWLPSLNTPMILIQDDLDCIHWKKMLSAKNQQYKQNDNIIKECLDERGVNYETQQETTNARNLDISLGQMTVYRMRLECTCPEDMLPNQSCKNISLHQSWSEYLGFQGNGYFKPFYKKDS